MHECILMTGEMDRSNPELPLRKLGGGDRIYVLSFQLWQREEKELLTIDQT